MNFGGMSTAFSVYEVYGAQGNEGGAFDFGILVLMVAWAF